VPRQGSRTQPRLYRELASWFHLLTPPENYAEEARVYRRTLLDAVRPRPRTLLELGSGGGNNASHMKRWFQMTLTDLSPQMIEISRSHNPELEHIRGDMRTLRLRREFDAVFAHDSLMYMTSEADLRAAIETAFVHCRAGGVALFVPDCTRETFRPQTNCGGSDGDDGRGLRYLEWTFDPDPEDTWFYTDFAYLLRSPDGTIRAEHDRHIEGVFGRRDWLRLLREAGFRPRYLTYAHSDAGKLVAFLALKPLRAKGR
jgi:hypothetical protein